MINVLKSKFWAIEKILTKHLPPEAIVYLLPLRFRIARYYFDPRNSSCKDGRQKALRYLELAGSRRKDTAEVFELDRQARQSIASGTPLTTEMSVDVLRTLLAQKPSELTSNARCFREFGRFRVAAVFRALLLLRSVLDNIALRQDYGKRHDAILLEIIANDFCQAVIEKPGVIQGPVSKTLGLQLKHASEWSLDRKISIFVDADTSVKQRQALPLQGSTVKIQGPSNRTSNLSDLDTDTAAVVGYSGPDSLVCPVERVDVSMYSHHTVRKLRENSRADVVKDVQFPVICTIGSKNRPEFNFMVSEYGAVYSNIRNESFGSFFNTGVDLFLWVLAAGASRVVVTNFDMFVNQAYPSGYIAKSSEDMLERDAETFRVKREMIGGEFDMHDPSHQYSIYKCFKHHNEIQYDSVLDGIVFNPLSDYINEIEDLYGP